MRKASTRRYGRSYAPRKRFSPRFATVGFNRDVEKKYLDKALRTVLQNAPIDGGSDDSSGWMFKSTAYAAEPFAGGTYLANEVTSDLLKGLNTGTTVTNRIGNKIRARYLKGAITFTCAVIKNDETKFVNAQFGEAVVQDPTLTTLRQYLRTTWRFCIVKRLTSQQHRRSNQMG